MFLPAIYLTLALLYITIKKSQCLSEALDTQVKSDANLLQVLQLKICLVCRYSRHTRHKNIVLTISYILLYTIYESLIMRHLYNVRTFCPTACVDVLSSEWQ